MIRRVISGGQTGADRGGLTAAYAAGVAMGGYCPAGRRAEDGCVPPHFPLQETTSSDYRHRTALNVEEADATLVFVMGGWTSGTRLTADIAEEVGKPYLAIDLMGSTEEEAAHCVMQWARDTATETLNVAGTRESRAPGIQAAVTRVVYAVLVEQHRTGGV